MSHSTMGIVMLLIGKDGKGNYESEPAFQPQRDHYSSAGSLIPHVTAPQPGKTNASSRTSNGYVSTTTPSKTSRRAHKTSTVTTAHETNPTSTETRKGEGNVVFL